MSDHQIIKRGSTDYIEEPLLGTAQWMPPAQVADRYIFEEGDLWLGRNGDDERTPIGRKDDSHVLLCAKTRSGKGRALITNNLLLWPGSIFVNDPKGENASVTAARRGNGSDHAIESLGQKVCVLDSHETATVNPDYRAYYNPIAEIRADDPDAETKAAIIAESCISSKKEKADPTWDNKAKTFIKTLILHIATDRFIPDEDRNMVTLRRFIVAGDFIAVGHVEDQVSPEQLKANPPDGFMMLLEGMKANKVFDGIVSDQARSLLESYASQPKMWNSIRTSAEENTDWIDDNRIRSVLKPGKFGQTFTADELQGRAGGISVYMCLPSGMKDHFASWPRIVVNMMLTAAQTNGNRHPATGHQTLMMLDEFASMERMRRIETAAADIAGAGVKLFFVVQSLTQLKAIYDENWETFASAADTHIYYGFNDNFTAEYVSKRLGDVEVIRRLRSQSAAKNTTVSKGTSKGGSSSVATNTSDARSKGGGSGTSHGGSSGTSDTTGWGPSIFFRTLATTNQFARQTGRNFGSTRQENFQRTKTKGKTKTSGENWNETHTIAEGTVQTSGMQESIHKKPLAAINELMRLFGDVEDENDPTYPGIGLISTASRDPMLIQKCHYDEDRFFEALFDPHPKHGFTPLPDEKRYHRIPASEFPLGSSYFDGLPQIAPLQRFAPYKAKLFGLFPYDKGPESEVHCTAASPDMKTFAAGGFMGVFKWDIQTGEVLKFINGFNTLSIDLSKDGKRLISGGFDGVIELNDYVDEKRISIHSSKKDHHHVRAIKFLGNGERFITGQSDGGMKIWDTDTLEAQPISGVHEGDIYDMRVSEDGALAYYISDRSWIGVIDTAAGMVVDQIYLNGSHNHRSTLSINIDSQKAVTVGQNSVFWADLATQNVTELNQGFPEGHGTCVGISPNGKYLISSYLDVLALWDTQQLRPIATLDGHDGPINGVSFSTDGALAFTAGKDKAVVMWRMPT